MKSFLRISLCLFALYSGYAHTEQKPAATPSATDHPVPLPKTNLKTATPTSRQPSSGPGNKNALPNQVNKISATTKISAVSAQTDKKTPPSNTSKKAVIAHTESKKTTTKASKKTVAAPSGKRASAATTNHKIPSAKTRKKNATAQAGKKTPQIITKASQDPAPAIALAAGLVPGSGMTADSGITQESGINTVIGKAKLIRLTRPVARVAVGDPRVADFVVISPSQLYMLGKNIGSTNVIFWYTDGASETLDAYVILDATPLINILKKELPDETDLRVSGASGAIVLSGTISDTVVANTVMNLAESHARSINRSLRGDPTLPATSTPPIAFPPERSVVQVVNLLKIRDSQQVMLEVKIAEIRKDLLDKLGIGVMANGGGDVRWSIISSGTPGTFGFASLFNRAGLDGLTLNAEKIDKLVKVLAEPTIVAMSGQEGSFLAGGKILIPVVQSTGLSGNTITLQEKEFGVGLKFVPTVLSGGRVNLQVAPEVSEVSPTPLIFSTGSGSNAVYPQFVTRRVNTTVQLQEGQSLIIGGLLGNNLAETVKAFPFLGELPIIGPFFRSSEMKNERTELLVVVSPSLARAINVSPALPTDQFITPTRTEFLLENKLEGNPVHVAPSNVPVPKSESTP